MPLPTDLPTGITAGQLGHDTGHNAANTRVNVVAAAVNALGSRTGVQSAYASAFGAVLDGTTNDSAAILAAFNSLKDGSGRAFGHLVIDGRARLGTALVLDLGYTGTLRFSSSGLATATSQGEQFRITCLGPIVADAGLGNAVTIKNGFNPIIDMAFEGGGNSTDNALHLENLLGLDILRLYGVKFAGTLLHIDGSGGNQFHVAQATMGYLYADSCGRLLSLNTCEGFGRIDRVWDVWCTNGSVFANCDDVGIGHWESYTPATQTYGLDFQACNSFNVGTLTFGDRPTTALVRVQGGDFGRINQIRASGNPDGSYTGDGLLLSEVSSIDIDNLQTFRCGGAALHIVGGGGNGIRVKRHFSMTSDGEPLRIDAGTGTTPRVDVRTEYRFHTRASALIGTGLTGGMIRISGYTEGMWQSGTATKYAIDCQSAAVTLDLGGLFIAPRVGLAAYVNPAATGLLGVQTSVGPGGYIAYNALSGSNRVTGTAQTLVSNTATETVVAGPMTIPANSVVAGETYRLSVWGNIDNIASATLTFRLRIGGVTGTSVWGQAITVGSTKTGQAFWYDARVTFRTVASSTTPTTVGGLLYNGMSATTNAPNGTPTNVNMTTARDMVVAAVWTAADPANILRVEGYVIEKIV